MFGGAGGSSWGNSSSSHKMKLVVTESRQQRLLQLTTAVTGVLHGSDIVKTGYLHIKRPPSRHAVKIRIRAWQKRFFVLRDESFREGTTMLDIFSSYNDWVQDPLNAEEYSVDLRTVSLVEEYRDSKSFPYAFVVTRSGRSPLVLGTDSDLEMKEWLVAIKMLSDKLKNREPPKVAERRPSCPGFIQLSTNTPQGLRKTSTIDMPCMKTTPSNSPRTGSRPSVSAPVHGSGRSSDPAGFPVTIQCCEGAQRNSLHGEYSLSVSACDVILRTPAGGYDVIRWPVLHIRKFKSETVGTGMDQITLEASQKCGKAAGTYIFNTLRGQEIIEKVRQANRKLSSDENSRHLVNQMERLKSNLKVPGSKLMERTPSAPCLNQLVSGPRHTIPLPPIPCSEPPPPGQQNRRSSSSSRSSASSSSEDFLALNVVIPEKKFYMGQGYLDLLDTVGLSASLDKLILPSNVDDGSLSEETSIAKDSALNDYTASYKIQPAVAPPVECAPPPLPPRIHPPPGRAARGSVSPPPALPPETFTTHL